MFNLVKHKNKFFIFSTVLVIASAIALLLWGLKPGLDFTGGALLEVEYAQKRPVVLDIEHKISSLVEKPLLIPAGERGLIVKMKLIDEAKHQQLLAVLKEQAGAANALTETRFEMIGPTISSELKTRSFMAMIFVLSAIILYIAFAFRKVSRPVSSWKYGICAIIALFHDVMIPTGVFAILGKFMGVEVDTLFVTALLTILGFSVHDTIVVFDRIRENLLKFPRETFEEVVNRSVNQTAKRSISTSATILLVLLASFFFGGDSVKYFILTLIIGVICGTYSSIFIASPLLVAWNRAGKK